MVADEETNIVRDGWLSILRLDPACCFWLDHHFGPSSSPRTLGGLAAAVKRGPLLGLLADEEWIRDVRASEPIDMESWGQAVLELQLQESESASVHEPQDSTHLYSDYMKVARDLCRLEDSGAGETALASPGLHTLGNDPVEASGHEEDQGGDLRRSVQRHWTQPGAAIDIEVIMLLAARMLRLTELEKDYASELQAAKTAAVAELAYGAGHEINNPLANISTRAQTLLHDETDPEKRRRLATINTQAFRAHEMIADMMLFAKPPTLKPRTMDLRRIVQQVVQELGRHELANSVTVTADVQDLPIEVTLDPIQLTVALKALGKNALEAISGAGEVQFQVRNHRVDDHGAAMDLPVVIEVTDSGPGIPADLRMHLFDPYFSGRESGRGLGMGLCKVWRIVTDHGGQIVVDSPSGGGTTFSIRLPRDGIGDRVVS